jgi:hypothetical protein
VAVKIVAIVLLGLAAAGGAPRGAFQVTLATRDLVAAGASAREASWDTGTWRLTFRGRLWTLRQAQGRFGNAVQTGTVEVSGARLALTLRTADGFRHNEFVGTVAWRPAAGGLRFTPVAWARNRDVVQILAARPWVRAG